MSTPLSSLPKHTLPASQALALEREAVQAFIDHGSDAPLWALRLERLAVQAASWSFLGWAALRVFAS